MLLCDLVGLVEVFGWTLVVYHPFSFIGRVTKIIHSLKRNQYMLEWWHYRLLVVLGWLGKWVRCEGLTTPEFRGRG